MTVQLNVTESAPWLSAEFRLVVRLIVRAALAAPSEHANARIKHTVRIILKCLCDISTSPPYSFGGLLLVIACTG